ncbi:hypothetical protein [Halalkalibacterium ligniniphilum]|uniref:hypothetical protein n=1 Tax=Halalkalibacterium ligniniphilum TaxID=1134413 RepID=UPI0003493F65|nr:hypothetical protein [Halalkalibacterium ligniniphilum]
MSDNQFDKLMEQLKNDYDKMPTQSSPTKIMAGIKKQKKRNWFIFFRQWQVAAMIILTIGIGSVLVMNQIGSQNETSLEANDRSTVNESTAIDEAAELFSTEMEQGDLAELQGNQKEDVGEETPDGAVAEDTSEEAMVGASAIEPPDEEAAQFLLEGTEGELNVSPLQDDKLSFYTYYDSRFDVERVTDEEMTGYEIYMNFSNGPIEPSVFEIALVSNNQAVNEEIEAIRQHYVNGGYAEISANSYMIERIPAQVITEFAFQKDGYDTHVAAVEFGEELYFFTTHKVSKDNVDQIELNEAYENHFRYIASQFRWLY